MASPRLRLSPVSKSPSKKDSLSKSRLHSSIKEDRAISLSLTSRSAPFTWNQFMNYPALMYVHESSYPNEFSQYSLEDLCEIPDDNTSNEKYLEAWWKHNIPAMDGEELLVQSYFVDEILDLAPFLTSVRMKPDLCVVNDGIPILWNEVYSRYDYDDTIAHCVLGLIAQFRYVRHFDQEINSVCGFVFPKKLIKSKVTLVKLEWKELQFQIYRQYIKLEEVIDEIVKVLENQRKFYDFCIKTIKALSNYFIGLSKSDLVYLRGVLGTGSKLVQHSSYSAILVKDDKYYYKIVPDQNESEKLLVIYCSYMEYLHESKLIPSISHLVLPNKIILHSHLPIFRFDSQTYQPLNRKEARKCLKDFVTLAKRALEELHKFGYAHFDVRLPNFCYSRQFEAMLIDFDRAIPNTPKPPSLSFELPHYFHRVPSRVRTPVGIDFKQLGILIYSVIEDEDMVQVDDLSDDDFKDSHDFICQLVIHGEFDKQLFEDFFESHQECNQSIQSVILDRIPSSTSDN